MTLPGYHEARVILTFSCYVPGHINPSRVRDAAREAIQAFEDNFPGHVLSARDSVRTDHIYRPEVAQLP